MTDTADAERMFDFWQTASVLAERGGFKELAREYRAKAKQQESLMAKTKTTAPAPAPAVEPPHVNWQLVCRKQFTSAGGVVFNCGAVVPVDQLGKNFLSLIENKYVIWTPPHMIDGRVNPRAAPAPEPPRKAMQAAIIRDPGGDIVKTWKLSVAETMRLSQCDLEVARCLLWATDAGSKVFLQATRSLAETNAISNRTPNRRIAAQII